jgi:hypothetical protein
MPLQPLFQSHVSTQTLPCAWKLPHQTRNNMLRMQTFCLPLNPITVNDHSLNLHTCEQNITKKLTLSLASLLQQLYAILNCS